MNEDIKMFSVVIKIKKREIIQINRLFEYKVKIIRQDKETLVIRIQERDLKILDRQNSSLKKY